MDPKELEDKSKSLIKQKLNEAIIDPFTYAVLKEKLDDNVDLQKRVIDQIGFLKQPKTAILISIFFGPLGLDRLYLFQPFLFVLKLCTIGGFGLWWLLDIFFISKATKKVNGKTITKLIAGKTLKKPLYFYLNGYLKSNNKLNDSFAKLNTTLTNNFSFAKILDLARNDYRDISIALFLVLLGYPSFIKGEPAFSYLMCTVATFFYGKFHLKKTNNTEEMLKKRSEIWFFEWFYNQANFSEQIPLAKKHDPESAYSDYLVGHVYGSFADFNFGAIKEEIESEPLRRQEREAAKAREKQEQLERKKRAEEEKLMREKRAEQEKLMREKRAEHARQEAERKRQETEALIAKYPEFESQIKDEEFAIDMPYELATIIFGEPADKKTDQTKTKKVETCLYGKYKTKRGAVKYKYKIRFTNGLIDSINEL